MANQKDYYYVFFHESVKCCEDLQDFCWDDEDNKFGFKTKDDIENGKYFRLRFANYFYGDARVLVKSNLPYAKLKKIINTKKEYWVHHHYEKHLEVVDSYFNSWAGKESGACHHQACLDGENFYDYEIGTNPKIDKQFEDFTDFYNWENQIILGEGFSFTDITEHYIEDQRVKRFDLEMDFDSLDGELSEAYINRPLEEVNERYRIEFEGSAINRVHSEGYTAKDMKDIEITYWRKVTGYAEIEYDGSLGDLKKQLNDSVIKVVEKINGMKFKNHIWLPDIVDRIADNTDDWNVETVEGTTKVIYTNFDYQGKKSKPGSLVTETVDENIVSEYYERVDGDWRDEEFIGVDAKSLYVTVIS